MTSVRTSLTDPIRIAALPLGAGWLGLTFCPGKKAESVLSGGRWERSLTADLDAIHAWGATIVVTLLEDHEFARLGVPELGAAVVARGMEWVHLPIPDLGVPDPATARRFASLSGRLRDAMTDGGKVLVHCRGGLGRTGLIGALLLVDAGMAASEAVRAVRVVRPGAIETAVQEAFLHRDRGYRCHACLLAGAIGDSLGAAIEFLSLDRIQHLHPQGVRALSRWGGVAGAITDDTQMTLFTAEGLIRAFVRGALKGVSSLSGCVHHALVRWLATQGAGETGTTAGEGLAGDPRLCHARAPGNTCLSALRAAAAGAAGRLPYGTPAQNDSKGCGTIMRVAPVAFLPDRADVRRAALATSALTHGHPTGQVAAAAWAEILRAVLDGAPVEAAARDVVGAYARDVANSGETCAALGRALAAPRDARPQTVERLGRGFVAEEALAIALYAALASDTPEEGWRVAVTHGGDSDSTGAICGNLLGIMYPAEVFAHRFAQEVKCGDLIARLAHDLAHAPYWDEAEATRQWPRYPGN